MSDAAPAPAPAPAPALKPLPPGPKSPPDYVSRFWAILILIVLLIIVLATVSMIIAYTVRKSTCDKCAGECNVTSCSMDQIRAKLSQQDRHNVITYILTNHLDMALQNPVIFDKFAKFDAIYRKVCKLPPLVPTSETSGGSNTTKIILIVFGVLVGLALLGGGGYYFYKQYKQKKKDALYLAHARSYAAPTAHAHAPAQGKNKGKNKGKRNNRK
jgi:flagellar basal body-associated protein FliL